ncbi:abortive infection system antitoxin AbiGi family protein [Faecalispora jeddahensis]|uniref:abortive infection system antitoxin AbiGi family protein n=1 Tax=Faecalispora jeddahensis TaxID=1414721 RepID=UPI0028B258BA|nr:abortive infection system antitoxin AbiGi family protein [Faecalispora jeddahensis]
MSNRPDFSKFLAHFTTSRPPVSKKEGNPVLAFESQSAKERLISILKSKKIASSFMPWTGCHAVCFTECPWSSLLDHTESYSPYGIGFEKSFIFSRNGSPVYYVRADQYDKQEWHEHLKPFVTPFWPSYRPRTLDAKVSFSTCDYSHEREWRVPHDLPFEYKNITFIILRDYTDMAQFPKDLKDRIGREKFILMDNYRNIEKLWPVHKLE